MMDFQERAKKVFLALNTTPNRFATDHGFNGASMYNLVTPNRKPGLDLLERICSSEPRISAEYLIRGEGEPLRDLAKPINLTTIESLRHFQSEMNIFIENKIRELRE